MGRADVEAFLEAHASSLRKRGWWGTGIALLFVSFGVLMMAAASVAQPGWSADSDSMSSGECIAYGVGLILTGGIILAFVLPRLVRLSRRR